MSKKFIKHGRIAAATAAAAGVAAKNRWSAAPGLLLLCCSIFLSASCGGARETVTVGQDNVAQTNTTARNFTGEIAMASPPPPAAAAAGGDKSAESSEQAAGVTGTYEFKAGSRSNEIKVLEIGGGGGGELKVSFLGNSEFDSQMGPMANSGEIARTIVKFKSGKAVLKPADAPGCRITLVFTGGNKLDVEQNENDCGFPGGVLADGSYHRISRKPPVFEEALNGASHKRRELTRRRAEAEREPQKLLTASQTAL